VRSEHGKPVHVGGGWRLVLRDLGLDERAVLRRAGLPPSLLDGEGTYISVEDFYALHEAVEAEADDPTLPLKAGRIVSIELFDPALFAAICSPDMNTAATRLGRFKRLVGAFSLDVDVGPEETRILYRCKHRPDIPRSRGLAEVVFLVALARRATRHEVVPRHVSVQRMPADLAPYEDFFGCPLTRDDVFAVTLSAADARRAFLTHNARMWEAFEPDLRRRMAEAAETRSTAEQVEAALFELLPSGRAQMKDVAKELGVGTRTLQRRLASEDTTWLAVLNRTRERLARHYLRSTRMSPAEVSFLLGFEDPNSLFRAFHRWTGTTPEVWRARADG
jgi:AraC-like DNA-binding protein